jgi:hypothetical protein
VFADGALDLAGRRAHVLEQWCIDRHHRIDT